MIVCKFNKTVHKCFDYKISHVSFFVLFLFCFVLFLLVFGDLYFHCKQKDFI